MFYLEILPVHLDSKPNICNFDTSYTQPKWSFFQPALRIDFENAVSGLKISNTNVIAVKKLSTMTPLQILCSFQTWNAKNVSDSVHKCLEKLVSTLLDKGKV